ncbi:ABC transporter permease [Pararobbsia silviterrae]|uniref:ABC transporter permease n=1 Tax=Pararobbsia silviterrae TaxID=1792498 RepID=UPI001314402C|nr:ABC transporter permease [Pararobbsia silviterrae]
MKRTFSMRIAEAGKDLWAALTTTETWAFLGWHDIRQRYRRSVLGPFWITISTAVLVSGLSVMYAGLFRMTLRDYIPYLASGMITWSFINTVINESCLVFMGSEGSIKNGQMPITSYVLRLVWRNMIVFMHNAVVLVVVVLIFLPFRPLGLLESLLGLVIVGIFLFWVALLVGLLSARFRDIPQIVTNVLQVVFFMTPIMWQASVLKNHIWIAQINPFFYMLELVRNPLLGVDSGGMLWLQVTGVVALTACISFLLFARFRSRIVYWL